MAVPRIYQNTTLKQGELTLDDKASHHLSRVLRVRVGDDVCVFNGKGVEFAAKIISINKKQVTVDCAGQIERAVESPLKLVLAQGIARGEKMDYIIQKAVELGVTDIYPLQTERCNVKLTDERMQKKQMHWQGVIESACEQSGRVTLPVLHPVMRYTDWLKSCEVTTKFILSPFVETKLTSLSSQSLEQVAIVIGPEGGLTDQEIKEAEQSACTPLNVGPRILRTETAAVAVLSIIQFYFGDMG